MKKIIPLTALGVLLVMPGSVAFAQQTANYTFDGPQFHGSPYSLANTGPFLGIAPDSGSASGVLASFDGSKPSSIQVEDNGDGGNPANSLASSQFSGQYLGTIKTSTSMIVTLNTPFTDLSVNFFLDVPGKLSLSADDVNSNFVGSVLQTGTYDSISTNYIGLLTFHSNIPFTSFTLDTTPTYNNGGPAAFGIDNLSLSTASSVPAPGSALVLGAGMLYPLAGLLRRRKEKAA